MFMAPRDITEGALFVVTLNGKKLRERIEYTTIRYGDIVNIVIKNMYAEKEGELVIRRITQFNREIEFKEAVCDIKSKPAEQVNRINSNCNKRHRCCIKRNDNRTACRQQNM